MCIMAAGKVNPASFAISVAFAGLSKSHMVSRINRLTGDMLILLHSSYFVACA
jgi:hypothetical protein